jgi:hypothetical protein
VTLALVPPASAPGGTVKSAPVRADSTAADKPGSYDRENREVRIGLNVESPDPEQGRQTKMAAFGVSCFDFPRIDDPRLVGGQRCAVVLNDMPDASADITLGAPVETRGPGSVDRAPGRRRNAGFSPT